MEDNPRVKAKIRARAWMLGLLVLSLYLGYMFLTALRGSGAIG